jgi:hypothetical protein
MTRTSSPKGIEVIAILSVLSWTLRAIRWTVNEENRQIGERKSHDVTPAVHLRR